MVVNVDWMADNTRKAALAKLDNFGVKIGYPDKWIDYSDLRLADSDSFVTVVRKLSEFEHYRWVMFGDQGSRRGYALWVIARHYGELLQSVTMELCGHCVVWSPLAAGAGMLTPAREV